MAHCLLREDFTAGMQN